MPKTKKAPSLFFFLDEKNVRELAHIESVMKSPIAFLEIKREEKYDHFIHKGHFFIAQKNFLEAQTNFFISKNYNHANSRQFIQQLH